MRPKPWPLEHRGSSFVTVPIERKCTNAQMLGNASMRRRIFSSIRTMQWYFVPILGLMRLSWRVHASYRFSHHLLLTQSGTESLRTRAAELLVLVVAIPTHSFPALQNAFCTFSILCSLNISTWGADSSAHGEQQMWPPTHIISKNTLFKTTLPNIATKA